MAREPCGTPHWQAPHGTCQGAFRGGLRFVHAEGLWVILPPRGPRVSGVGFRQDSLYLLRIPTKRPEESLDHLEPGGRLRRRW